MESKVFFCFAFFLVPVKYRTISSKSFYSKEIPQTKKGKALLKVVFLKHVFFGVMDIILIELTKLTFTCSKSTIETLEKGVKYVQKNTKKYQNDAIDVVLMSLLLTLNIFHTFFYCFHC